MFLHDLISKGNMFHLLKKMYGRYKIFILYCFEFNSLKLLINFINFYTFLCNFAVYNICYDQYLRSKNWEIFFYILLIPKIAYEQKKDVIKLTTVITSLRERKISLDIIYNLQNMRKRTYSKRCAIDDAVTIIASVY